MDLLETDVQRKLEAEGQALCTLESLHNWSIAVVLKRTEFIENCWTETLFYFSANNLIAIKSLHQKLRILQSDSVWDSLLL